ncbi:TPA: hypothetical protein RFW60_003371 [Klebsiella pneumoniae subsp. pneumoniae]|nr:hypothetical protein [Klebsiella pneumoniae subsp. pneumoniae]
MTITLQAVNELIASLESAGELSIREQKFLKLAKAFKQLAGENVALKAGVTYFAYSPEYGFDYFKDKQSAIDTAQAEIDAYREDADDGWSEDVQRVSWGIVIQQAQGFDAQGLHTSDSRHTYQTCNYRLVDSVEAPVTDAYLAGIKADGVDEFAAKLRIPGDDQFFDALAKGVALAADDFAKQLREGADK